MTTTLRRQSLLVLVAGVLCAAPACVEARPYSRAPYYRSYSGAAYQRGQADGYKRGYDDGRHGRGFDPVRERWYREGDRGYERRYGPRSEYKNAYRDAFRRGYEEGYRDARGHGRRGGWRRW
jgi:hypothetical protein